MTDSISRGIWIRRTTQMSSQGKKDCFDDDGDARR